MFIINDFEKDFINYLSSSKLNYIQKELAIKPEYIGVKMFDTPIFAYGDASDELFAGLRDKSAIGAHFRMPHEWNNEAKTVISIFLPFSAEVINSNCAVHDYPSDLWLHGRIEGQACIAACARFGEEYFVKSGFKAVSPTISSDFFAIMDSKKLEFTSNWSERHVAFICGLGTFGLSKGIITEKGMAGRLVSFITDAKFDFTERKYTDLYEYCTMCGKCARQCPVNAISIGTGKNHVPCSDFQDDIRIKSAPRYGCGKCQVNVPCATRNPSRRKEI